LVVTNQEGERVTIPADEKGKDPYQEGLGATQEELPTSPISPQVRRMVESECQPQKGRWACVRARIAEYLNLHFNGTSWVGYIDNVRVRDAWADVFLNVECKSSAPYANARVAGEIRAAILGSGLGITVVQVWVINPNPEHGEGAYLDPVRC
jgi:hypothetical protein